ncbi:MAG: hypothetical protein DWH91_19955 [Planctomycetota bacterium]|nr:MAG: hypothetical protein DWH91_19955 [Planctomycetota bacterium]
MTGESGKFRQPRSSLTAHRLTVLLPKAGRVAGILLGCLLNLTMAVSLLAQSPEPAWRTIPAPADWQDQVRSGLWTPVASAEWDLLVAADRPATEADSSSPVLMNAHYRATFDGQHLRDGTLEGIFQSPVDQAGSASAGFVDLGHTDLAIDDLQFGDQPARHGIAPEGRWLLHVPKGNPTLSGRWSRQGILKLGNPHFELTLPRALASEVELSVPKEWTIVAQGTSLPATQANQGPTHILWRFLMGRQSNLRLRMEKRTRTGEARLLVKENSSYSVGATDEMVRIRSEWDCLVNGGTSTILQLTVPKTLRVYNVMLGSELPLRFERQLGSEEDLIEVPLQSLGGQRLTVQLLGEAPRRTDRTFSLPRIRPANAALLEGALRVSVDRPLQVLSMAPTGLRQVQLTERDGQESWSYEVNSLDSQLSVNLSEPKPVPQVRARCVADLRGDSPVSLAHLRLSTREGEIFSPSLLIPPGWELIRVEGMGASVEALAAWTVAESSDAAGGTLASIELRQPIRTDRDCELWMELKSTRLPLSGARVLPVPAVRNVQSSTVEAIVWDNAPWETSADSRDSVTISSDPASEDLLKLVRWTRLLDPAAVTTRITTNSKTPFQLSLKTEGSSPIETTLLPLDVRQPPPTSGPLCVSVELETRTSPRDGRFHEHRAVLRLSRAVTPLTAPDIRLPEEAEITRVLTNEREVSFVRTDSRIVLNQTSGPFRELTLHYRTATHAGWVTTRDDIVFPVPNCLVTEFAWNVRLHSGRALYRLPLTAAASSQASTEWRSRLLGPLARHASDEIFHPFFLESWRELLNGTPAAGTAVREEHVWFLAPRVPERLTLKTWNRDQSHAFAWCSLLGCLTAGVALRRARRRWFSQTWIYAGGSWLVLALCLPEPYAPFAGGGFLGSLLAVIMPRRMAITPDWLKRWEPTTPLAITSISLLAVGVGMHSWLTAQDTPMPVVNTTRESFLIQDPTTGEETRYVSAKAQSQPQARSLKIPPEWLMQSATYRWASVDPQPLDHPPLLIGQFEAIVRGQAPITHVKIPLTGISLEVVDGLAGNERVRLIPARDGQGVIVPVSQQLVARLKNEAVESTDSPGTLVPIEIRFRPIPQPESLTAVGAMIPALPTTHVELPSRRWQVSEHWGTEDSSTENIRRVSLGGIGQLILDTTSTSDPASDNLTSLDYRTLLEAGPLSTRIQIGVRAEVRDTVRPTEFQLQLPPEMVVQSVTGVSIEQYQIIEKPAHNLLQVRLTTGPSSPIEIRGVAATTAAGQFQGPTWSPPQSTIPSTTQQAGSIGLYAIPGYTVVDRREDQSPPAMTPQTFVDSLIPGIAWRIPDLAWSRRSTAPVQWQLRATTPKSQARLSQKFELLPPLARWSSEATITNSTGVPFETQCQLDPRLQITAVSLKQDGVERLLHWSRSGDLLQIWIRDGQPGMQFLTIEGELPATYGLWTPPKFTLLSSETTDSAVTIVPPPNGRILPTMAALQPPAASSETTEEIHYDVGSPRAPTSLRIEPLGDELSVRAWIDVIPESDLSWQLHLRAQLVDTPRSPSAVRVEWSHPGLEDVRPGEKRDQLRQTTNAPGYIWRPTASKGNELSLRARYSPTTLPWAIPLPHLSSAQSRQTHIRVTELWVSLPKGGGHRPTRLTGQLQASAPPKWPPAWASSWSASRSLLFAGVGEQITIEPVSTEQLVRPVWSETMLWLNESRASSEVPALQGNTQYMIMAEGDAQLRIDDAALPHVRAIAVDGVIIPRTSSFRIPFQPSDLSHEVTLWWDASDGTAMEALFNPLAFSDSRPFPRWVGVVPHHAQLLVGDTPQRTREEYWTQRITAMLDTVEEFPGSPWIVDGPLLRHLSESRQELRRLTLLSVHDKPDTNTLDARWDSFLRSADVASAPLADAAATTTWTPEGLHSGAALCGSSGSIWFSPIADDVAHLGPRVFPRKWTVALSALLASLIAVFLLTWAVQVFRRYELAELIAGHPYRTLASLGVIWWLCLSPSVLGLLLVVFSTASGAARYYRSMRPPVEPGATSHVA